jgi:hypothetical protein
MTPLQRSRRLQAGLAGLGVLSTLGAAVGFDLATSTHHGAQTGSAGSSSGTGSDGRGANRRGSEESGENDDGGRATSQNRVQRSPVTPPSTSTPQATTSGS